MSSQGTASNHSGGSFERDTASRLVAAGLTITTQVHRFTMMDESPLRHDIVVETKDGPVVIECKWYGAAPGSAPGRALLAATLELQYSNAPRAIIVYGGPGWGNAPALRSIAIARAECAMSKVTVMSVAELEAWARGQNRR